jgi:hypothetical protein
MFPAGGQGFHRRGGHVGEYAAQALLDHPSSSVKDPANTGPAGDLEALLQAAKPEVVYTHNLADKHDTHVASALRLIEAVRRLPQEDRPKQLLGCEVWRDLDWLCDEDKQPLDVSAHENLQAALLGVFDSQVCGGKRYDLATLGRRRAHATYFQSHGVDEAAGLNFAMDLTPLVEDDGMTPAELLEYYVNRFHEEAAGRVERFSS